MSTRPKLIFLLNSAQRHLQQWLAAEQATAADQAGTPMPTPAQSGVLFALAKSDGVTMGQLAQLLDLEPPAVSGLVQRTEVLGWAQRRPCKHDGRTQRVWLQPAGRALLPLMTSTTHRVNQQLADGFTDAELQTVARWLAHVRQLPRAPQEGDDHVA